MVQTGKTLAFTFIGMVTQELSLQPLLCVQTWRLCMLQVEKLATERGAGTQFCNLCSQGSVLPPRLHCSGV